MQSRDPERRMTPQAPPLHQWEHMVRPSAHYPSQYGAPVGDFSRDVRGVGLCTWEDRPMRTTVTAVMRQVPVVAANPGTRGPACHRPPITRPPPQAALGVPTDRSMYTEREGDTERLGAVRSLSSPNVASLACALPNVASAGSLSSTLASTLSGSERNGINGSVGSPPRPSHKAMRDYLATSCVDTPYYSDPRTQPLRRFPAPRHIPLYK